jgi:hypothetical protein
MSLQRADLRDLPGAEIVLKGLDDLDAGRSTTDGAAVQVAASRLRAGGLPVPERELFAAIEPELYRFPAVDAAAFRVKLERALG